VMDAADCCSAGGLGLSRVDREAAFLQAPENREAFKRHAGISRRRKSLTTLKAFSIT
jgi:hypothetical protein